MYLRLAALQIRHIHRVGRVHWQQSIMSLIAPLLQRIISTGLTFCLGPLYMCGSSGWTMDIVFLFGDGIHGRTQVQRAIMWGIR